MIQDFELSPNIRGRNSLPLLPTICWFFFGDFQLRILNINVNTHITRKGTSQTNALGRIIKELDVPRLGLESCGWRKQHWGALTSFRGSTWLDFGFSRGLMQLRDTGGSDQKQKRQLRCQRCMVIILRLSIKANFISQNSCKNSTKQL